MSAEPVDGLLFSPKAQRCPDVRKFIVRPTTAGVAIRRWRPGRRVADGLRLFDLLRKHHAPPQNCPVVARKTNQLKLLRFVVEPRGKNPGAPNSGGGVSGGESLLPQKIFRLIRISHPVAIQEHQYLELHASAGLEGLADVGCGKVQVRR